jgi:hypothetical protein
MCLRDGYMMDMTTVVSLAGFMLTHIADYTSTQPKLVTHSKYSHNG